jgi:hypothetical protein
LQCFGFGDGIGSDGYGPQYTGGREPFLVRTL